MPPTDSDGPSGHRHDGDHRLKNITNNVVYSDQRVVAQKYGAWNGTRVVVVVGWLSWLQRGEGALM